MSSPRSTVFSVRHVALSLLFSIVLIVLAALLLYPPNSAAGSLAPLPSTVHQQAAKSSSPQPGKPASMAGTTFGPNVRANSDTTVYSQHEPSLAASRTHPNTVVVASKDYRSGNVKQVWIEVSTDGGATWPAARQLQMPGLPSDLNTQSDPVVMARDDGRIYVACLGVQEPDRNRGGIFITWTDDDGATWHTPSAQVFYPDFQLDDKDWLAIDNTPSSPFYHRMYVMYAPSGQDVVEQHSADGGITWSARQQIGFGGTEYPYPVVARDGAVYTFMLQNWGPARVGNLQVTRSTDGGATWSAPATVAQDHQPPSPIRQGDEFRFFSILSGAADPNTGDLYVAWTDSRDINTDGTDVVYIKGTGGGTVWSAPARLSHDPPGIVRDHITPMLYVGQDSRLHAFWLDRRLSPSNTLFDSWYSSSADGGETWEPDVRVSSGSQDLDVGFAPGSGNAAGDYWGLDVSGASVYVAWNDSRSGDQDILVSKGAFSNNPPTLTPTPTSMLTLTPTSTPTLPPTVTLTPIATLTITPISTLTPTPGMCAAQFADVSPGSTFYPYVMCLACRNVAGGYPCGSAGEPCDATNTPYFRPGSAISRGQISKIVSQSAGFDGDPGPQIFEDVPPGSTFYAWVNRLALRGIMGGYGCGNSGEPCISPGNRPYFEPGKNASRGQLSKIVSNAANITTPVPNNQQTYTDVPADSAFWLYIERLTSRGVIGGYPCGLNASDACDNQGRPYFHPAADVTRGQSSKIVSGTFFPNCEAGR